MNFSRNLLIRPEWKVQYGTFFFQQHFIEIHFRCGHGLTSDTDVGTYMASTVVLAI